MTVYVLSSLHIGVSRRDAFLELIEVTVDQLITDGGERQGLRAEPFTEAMSGVDVTANHFTTVMLSLEALSQGLQVRTMADCWASKCPPWQARTETARTYPTCRIIRHDPVKNTQIDGKLTLARR
jgi:hypothetical protein